MSKEKSYNPKALWDAARRKIAENLSYFEYDPRPVTFKDLYTPSNINQGDLNMSDYLWTKYQRKGTVEFRDLIPDETVRVLAAKGISISDVDLELQKDIFIKGKIARNPDNISDQWYVSADYFNKNYEKVPGCDRPL